MVKLIWKCRKCGVKDKSNRKKTFYWAHPSLCKKCEKEMKRRAKAVKEYTVRINSKGEIFFLYDDDSPLRQLGEMACTRASHVELNPKTGKWAIYMIDPRYRDNKLEKLPDEFEYRRDAIAHEIQVLNERAWNGLDMSELFSKGKK